MAAGRDEYLEECRQRWGAAMRNALGSSPANRSEWQDPSAMIDVLRHFLGKGVQHTYLPTGGGMTMEGVGLGHERGTIELRPAKRVAYLLKPERMSINYFPQAPAQSFIFITTKPLKQTDVYDHQLSREQEEVVELGPCDYRPRSAWDHGEVEINGQLHDLPGDARLVCRFLGGSFMMVGEGSFWNGHPNTYDGEHDQLGEAKVRALIERIIERDGLQ